jgi:hypothetical protein
MTETKIEEVIEQSQVVFPPAGYALKLISKP